MKIIVVPILLLNAISLLRAQESGNPQGPLLNRASIPSQWIITTQALNPEPGGKPSTDGTVNSTAAPNPPKTLKPKVTTVVRNENLILEKTIAESGAVIETWILSGQAVTGINRGNWVIRPLAGSTFSTTDYSKTDFAGLDWISLKNFSGRANVLGKSCLIFKDKVMTMEPQEVAMIKALAAKEAPIGSPPFNTDSLKVDVEADIDDKTRLPIRLTYKEANGVTTRTYSFQSPDSSLDVPTEVKQLLKKTQQYQKRLSVSSAPI